MDLAATAKLARLMPSSDDDIKRNVTTYSPSIVSYKKTDINGEYRFSYANIININFIGHYSVFDANHTYITKMCDYRKIGNLVQVFNINYNAYERCEYDIVVPKNVVIEINVTIFHMEKDADKLWLEDMNGRKIVEITENKYRNFTLSYDAKLIFQSDGSLQQLGFSLYLEAIIALKNLDEMNTTANLEEIITNDTSTSVNLIQKNITAVVIVFFIISLFIACCGVGCWFYKKKKYEKLEAESTDITSLHKKYSIPQKKIKLSNILGTGVSADVYLATYKNGTALIKVAVKILKDDSCTKADTFREIKLLSTCKHKNIVQFIGWMEKEGQISIVTEFMGGGELHAYLQNPDKLLLVSTVFSYILQVLNSMTYLSHKHILHRDLAARNCLLNTTYEILKVNDFGLARETDFTYKGDIWSFGVLIWEMFERSGNLYNNMGLRDLIKFLKRRQRLSRPYHCPLEIYNLMLECWDEKPENRPIFDGLQIEIKNIFLEMITHHPDALNVAIEIGSGYEHPNN